jgi:hypothetical protein
MYDLSRVGIPPAIRLSAPQGVTPTDFDRIAAEVTPPVRARKTGFVAARTATAREAVETRWNGAETKNVAEPGDIVATNLDPDGVALRDAAGNLNTYVIRAARFPELYEPTGRATEHGPMHRARTVVEAIHLPGGFEILAPWGEIQRADDGYLLRSGTEVYGNARGTFEATYEILR